MLEEEEDDDYMSDKFLNESKESTARPGLLFSQSQKRQLELYKKNLLLKRSFKEVSRERTEDGLNTALPESNKGFKLLKKLGYEPGSGLGKLKAGPSNPINLEVKDNKFGLGLKRSLKEKDEIKNLTSFETYRSTMKKRIKLSDLRYDYGRIRRACHYLDEKDDLSKPLRKWFWPDDLSASKSDDEDDDDNDHISSTSSSDTDDTDEEKEKKEKKKDESYLSVEELQLRVDQISLYLREKYNYCLWCGCEFDDENDLKQICPGRTREEHEGSAQPVSGDANEEN